MSESKHTPIPAILNPTPEMLDAFQGGFVEQLHLRHQCRFKQSHQLNDRQRESAEQAGLRSMLAALPADRARLIAAAPDMYEALRTARQQVVTLGGDVIEIDGRIVSDAIQAAVLSVIDAALAKAEAR